MFAPKIGLPANANNVTSLYFLYRVFIECKYKYCDQDHILYTEGFCNLATPLFDPRVQLMYILCTLFVHFVPAS